MGKHMHDFKRSKPSASVETCSCGKWRHTENAGEAIVAVTTKEIRRHV